MELLFRARAYLKYLFKAKGAFSVHSPFIYHFYTEIILNDDKKNPIYPPVEKIRGRLLKNHNYIDVTDLGTASGKAFRRKISHIASRYASNARDARLLSRIAASSDFSLILELGTSLGISTMYIGIKKNPAQIITIEGCPATAALATQNFKELGLNITLLNGDILQQLPGALKQHNKARMMIYFDGNHREEATLSYFGLCKQYAGDGSVFIFDDIYWSEQMCRAWNLIVARSKAEVCIDLYKTGIVLFNKKNHGCHHILRY